MFPNDFLSVFRCSVPEFAAKCGCSDCRDGRCEWRDEQIANGGHCDARLLDLLGRGGGGFVFASPMAEASERCSHFEAAAAVETASDVSAASSLVGTCFFAAHGNDVFMCLFPSCLLSLMVAGEIDPLQITLISKFPGSKNYFVGCRA